MTIEDIEERLKIGNIQPHELADMRGFLASAYSYTAGQLQEVLIKKPKTWMELRTQYKSDKATDRAWEATQSGVDEMTLKLALKRIEKLIGACKSLLVVAEGEARNQW